jgi:hypothetical protein
VRLEGMEKENIGLKYDIHFVTKELDARMSELEHARKASDVATRQHGEALKKVAKLDEECTRLRTLLRKKLPSTASAPNLGYYQNWISLGATSAYPINSYVALWDF